MFKIKHNNSNLKINFNTSRITITNNKIIEIIITTIISNIIKKIRANLLSKKNQIRLIPK